MSYGNTMHPFTQVQITEKGLEELAMIVDNVRNLVGYAIPISTDHYGHFDLNNGIRLGKALEKYRLAWLEDMVPWQYTEQWKTIDRKSVVSGTRVPVRVALGVRRTIKTTTHTTHPPNHTPRSPTTIKQNPH